MSKKCVFKIQSVCHMHSEETCFSVNSAQNCRYKVARFTTRVLCSWVFLGENLQQVECYDHFEVGRSEQSFSDRQRQPDWILTYDWLM